MPDSLLEWVKLAGIILAAIYSYLASKKAETAATLTAKTNAQVSRLEITVDGHLAELVRLNRKDAKAEGVQEERDKAPPFPMM